MPEEKQNSFLQSLFAVNRAGDSVDALSTLVSRAVGAENKYMFSMIYSKFDGKKDGLHKEDFWQKAVDAGNIDFVERASFDQDLFRSFDDVRGLNEVFEKFFVAAFDEVLGEGADNSSKGKPSNKKNIYRKLMNFVKKAESHVARKNLYERLTEVNPKAPKGDFPDVIINTEGAAYRFSGLTKKEIAEKGLSVCLKERFEEYKKDFHSRCDACKKAYEKGDKVNLDKFLSEREQQFYYGTETPDTDLTDAEFTKANKLIGLCTQFSKTSAAPLVDLLTSEGRSLVIHKDDGVNMGGACSERFVFLNNIENLSTLHHELIHNADHTLHFTQTPAFKALKNYCDKKICDFEGSFWGKMWASSLDYPAEKWGVEVPAFLASLSYEQGTKPKNLKGVLDFIHAYTKAHLMGDTKEEERLASALQCSDARVCSDPFTYLQKVASSSIYSERRLSRGGKGDHD